MEVSKKNLRRGVSAALLVMVLFLLNIAWPHLVPPTPKPAHGFSVEVMSDDLGAPTCLEWVDSEWLLVCDNDADAIALHHLDGAVITLDRHLAEGFEQPQGVLYDADSNRLFVSDRGRLTRFDVSGGGPADWLVENRSVLIEGVPAGNHQTNAITAAPDGSLIWHSGSTCNICQEGDERNAALLSVNPDNGTHHVIASGVRNSYDGVWMPGVGYLFTDNGRDWEGEGYPPEELDLLEIGASYGWPDDSPDSPVPEGTLPPVANFTPHSSANGIALRPAKTTIPGGERTIYVTTYGSWNAAVPTGSELIRVDLIEDVASVQGWRAETTVVIGELPGALGIDFHPGGDLYIAQHGHGRLLRITFTA